MCMSMREFVTVDQIWSEIVRGPSTIFFFIFFIKDITSPTDVLWMVDPMSCSSDDIEYTEYQLPNSSVFQCLAHNFLSYSDCGCRLGGELDEAAQERWCCLRDTTSVDDQLQGGRVPI